MEIADICAECSIPLPLVRLKGSARYFINELDEGVELLACDALHFFGFYWFMGWLSEGNRLDKKESKACAKASEEAESVECCFHASSSMQLLTISSKYPPARKSRSSS
jgi:hypothetical protein